MPAQEYLEAILDSLKKILPKEIFNEIHTLALPSSGGRAKANQMREKKKLESSEIVKSVVDFQDLPLADRKREWDSTQADKNVRTWAGGPDKETIDWEKYKQGFLWYDEEDQENYGGYKFGVADVIDGTLMAVPRAIFACAAILNGARLPQGVSQINVPKKDIQGMKNHIDRYYAKMRSAWEDDSLTSPFKKDDSVLKIKAEQQELEINVPSLGQPNSVVTFVGASPGKIDYLRGIPFVGPSGETLQKLYLNPLELKREDVFLTNTVPNLLLDDNGNVREPTDDEISTWHQWLMGELDRANSKIIIALGQTAKKALGEEADFILPHPIAIRRYKDSGEVGRKIKQVKTKMKEMEKSLPSTDDVHIPSTEWRRFKKANLEDENENIEVYADIIKADVEKRLVYGVVLEPGGVDSQNDTISADEIENAAHTYLKDSRIVGDSHKTKAKAEVVESYIAPVDFEIGGQPVKKGTWILVVKINDEKMWQDVKDKAYDGFSVGGFSKRIPTKTVAS